MRRLALLIAAGLLVAACGGATGLGDDAGCIASLAETVFENATGEALW